MIGPERLTIKANEAIQQSAALARGNGNPVVNDAHLFMALLDQDEGIVAPVLQKTGVNVTELRSMVERELAKLPSQTGEVQSTFARELNAESRK